MGSFIINAVLYLIDSALCAFIIYLNKVQPEWCFPKTAEVSPLRNDKPASSYSDTQ